MQNQLKVIFFQQQHLQSSLTSRAAFLLPFAFLLKGNPKRLFRQIHLCDVENYIDQVWGS